MNKSKYLFDCILRSIAPTMETSSISFSLDDKSENISFYLTRWFFETLRFVFLLNCVNVSFLYVNNML